MNKKVLSALLFGALMAGTGTFTSCIDTDEPAGIEELRGAKAELIRAKVAVEAAEAARLMAVAEYEKAKAAHEQANAEYRLAEAKYKEAETAAKEAQTAQDQAKFENEMAQAQLKMEEAAKKHELTMAGMEKQLAEAQFNHEVVLKQIAIAKALGIENLNEATLDKLAEEVSQLYDELYAQGGLADKIREAEKALYNATMDKEAGNGYDWIPSLELNVVEKEAALAAKEEAVAKLEAFLEKDVETTDWRAEIEALNDSVEALKNAVTEKEVEKEKALNSEEYLAAYQKVNGVGNEKGTEQLLADAIAKHDKVAADANNALKVSAINLPVNEQLVASVEAAISAYNSGLAANKTQSPALSTKNGVKGFYIAETEYNHARYNANGEAKTAEDVVLAQVNAFIAALDKATINQENIEWAELTKEMKEEAVLKADTAYQEALVLWEIAKAAVKGTATEIPAEEAAKVTAAITAYNTAVATLAAKVEAYNTTHDEIYQAGYDAAVADKYNTLYWNTFKTQTLIDLADDALFADKTEEKVDALQTINTNSKGEINYSALLAAVEALYVTNVEDDAATTDKNEKTEAQKTVNEKLAAAKKAANNAAEIEKINTDNWASTGKPAGNQAITDAKAKDKALYNASAAIDAAVKALYEVKDGKTIGAHAAMVNAWAAYKELAADVYAQVQTADAAKIALPAAPTTWSADKDADANGFVYKKSNAAAMDATKVADMMEFELDENKAESALLNTTHIAFGLKSATQGRLTMPTEKEMKADPTYTKDGADVNGAWYAYYLAKEELQTLNDQLAQTENLAALKTAATAAKDALAAEIAANDKKFDAYHTAITEAIAANKAAKEELAAIEVELAGEIATEIAKLNAKITAVENVAGTLADAVNAHLHLDGVEFDAESFEKDLATALLDAKKKVATAEKDLAAAEVALQKAEEGLYDGVADAQYKLDQLLAEYELAMIAYEQALEDLQKAIEIMLGE